MVEVSDCLANQSLLTRPVISLSISPHITYLIIDSSGQTLTTTALTQLTTPYNHLHLFSFKSHKKSLHILNKSLILFRKATHSKLSELPIVDTES